MNAFVKVNEIVVDRVECTATTCSIVLAGEQSVRAISCV